ncbi:hypothetical protein [Hwanghaeella sp.]|uniref:hypothetical protein n=1 Tax=Hwanghaeella sp. TaxID=2605943 RepID=UPI003CCC1A1B
MLAEKKPLNAVERLSEREYHRHLHVYWIGVLAVIFVLDTYLYFKVLDWDAACRGYVAEQAWGSSFAVLRGCNALVPALMNLAIFGVLTALAQALWRRFRVIDS